MTGPTAPAWVAGFFTSCVTLITSQPEPRTHPASYTRTPRPCHSGYSRPAKRQSRESCEHAAHRMLYPSHYSVCAGPVGMPLHMGEQLPHGSLLQNSLGPGIGDRIISHLLSLTLVLQFSLGLTFFLGSLMAAQCRERTPSQELGSHNTGREPP